MDEVHNIVQEVVIKTIPNKRKCKKAKWLSEEALKKAEKEEKLKAKKKRQDIPIWIQEFQRIARRDQKAFLREHAKIEEYNRIGKTRGLFKKIRDTKGKFHARLAQ